LKGQIFADAFYVLRQWPGEGIPPYILSSGPVQSQVQFHQFNERSDLRHFFSGHFDTDIDSKVDAESCRRIAAAIAFGPVSVNISPARSSALRFVRA
jgi:enolase-phosphatase E1